MAATLAIFADGDKYIGMGHLARMRTLAAKLGMEPIVFTRTPDGAEAAFGSGADAAGEIRTVAAPEDIPAMIESGDGADSTASKVFVFDPPAIRDDTEAVSGPAWQWLFDAASSRGWRTVRFCDEAEPTAHRCDLLVNDNPLADTFGDRYREAAPAMKTLTGLRYFLIDGAHQTASPDPYGGIFVSFGGGDQSDLIARFRPALERLAARAAVHLVIGPAATPPKALPEAVTVHRGLPPAAFAALMAGAKIAVTAAGNTMFERVFHQRPGLSVAQFEHQQSFGHAFAERGLTVHLGMGERLAPDALADAAEALWDNEDARNDQTSAAADADIRAGAEQAVAAVRDLLNG